MKIKIQFSYVEDVIPAGCRKARPVRFHDGEIELDINEVSAEQAPIAIRAKSKPDAGKRPLTVEYHWWNKRLWTNIECQDGEPYLDIETKKPKKYAIYGKTIDLRSNRRLENYQLGICLSSVTYTKDDAIAYLKKWASDELIIDGLRYKPTGEPYYHSVTFGFGSNHGGTACMIGSTEKYNDCDTNVFNLLEREKAIEATTKIARKRGDSRNLPIKPHGPQWEILLPESIQIKPLEKRFKTFVGSIQTKVGGSACKFEFAINSGASHKEIESAAREAAFKHIEWSYQQI